MYRLNQRYLPSPLISLTSWKCSLLSYGDNIKPGGGGEGGEKEQYIEWEIELCILVFELFIQAPKIKIIVLA